MIKRISVFIIIGLGIITLFLCLFLFSIVIYSRGYSPELIQFGKHSEHVLLTNAHIVDIANNQVIKNQVIEIKNGIISSISDSILNPTSSPYIIDLEGKYVSHGIADMHTHVFDRADLMLNLAYGITFARNMMGNKHHLTWREEVKSGELTGSYMHTSSPTFNGYDGAPPLHLRIEDVNEVETAVISAINDGYDLLKLYDGIDSTSLAHIIRIADSLGVGYAGHPPRSITNQSLYSLNYTSLEHVEELFQGLMEFKFDSSLADSIIFNLKKNDIHLTITLSAYNHLYQTVLNGEDFIQSLPVEKINPVIRFIGNKGLESWKEPSQRAYDWTLKKYSFMEELVRKLYAAESPTLLGTDTGPNLTVHGWSIHREMSLLSDIGIKNQDILLSGTVNAAEVLDDPLFPGIIDTNVAANLLVLEDNPLSNLSTLKNPKRIILIDAIYDEADLQNLKKYAIDSFSPWYVTVGILLDQIYTNF